MHGPWTFAGRRFVAPRSLRVRRAEMADGIAQPADTGCYLSLYWITIGHEEDTERVVVPGHGRGPDAARTRLR
jgi:hypothetical protein